jgi:hypothetical protein
MGAHTESKRGHGGDELPEYSTGARVSNTGVSSIMVIIDSVPHCTRDFPVTAHRVRVLVFPAPVINSMERG